MPKKKTEIVNVPQAITLQSSAFNWARKVVLEKWKTVIRHPIKKA